jgi:hypothetical protein
VGSYQSALEALDGPERIWTHQELAHGIVRFGDSCALGNSTGTSFKISDNTDH